MQISPSSVDPSLVAADTKSKIDVAVAKKALDTERQQGEAVISMIKDAGAASKSIRTASGGIDVQA
jgi:hypothetical protein